MLKKQKDHGFGKDAYLLGKDEQGVKYWLECATFDCGWYWGFGYIESYRGNRKPSTARDIDSHQHADHFYSKWWGGDKPELVETTFTEKEGWELAELLKQFYTLRATAEYFGRGKENMGGTAIPDYKKPELVKEINEERMPIIFKRIYEILTPAE